MIVDHILSRSGRIWAYGVVVAGLGVLLGYEIVTEDQLGIWSNFAQAVLGTGGAVLALANVPSKEAYVGQHRKEG